MLGNKLAAAQIMETWPTCVFGGFEYNFNLNVIIYCAIVQEGNKERTLLRVTALSMLRNRLENRTEFSLYILFIIYKLNLMSP